MSITSIDQIDDLPVGATMADTLTETPWVKHEGGWSHSTNARARVQSSAFTLAVQAGRLSLVEPEEEPDPEPLAVTLTPERVSEALNGYVDEHGFPCSTEKYDLYEVMKNLGLEVPTEPVPVTVRVNGHTMVSLTDDQASDLVGGPVDVAAAREVAVHWTMALTLTNDVRAGACPCAAVTREEVDTALDDQTMRFTDYGFSTTLRLAGARQHPLTHSKPTREGSHFALRRHM